MNTSKLSVAIVGVGRFGALHARVWSEAGAHLVALVDTDLGRAREVGVRYGVDVIEQDLSHALSRAAADLVVVASTEATHVELAHQALEAGAHVFVEKPLALSSQEAWGVHQAAQDRRLEVIVGHISRFAAPYRRMHQRATAGHIGRLSTLRFRRDFSRDWFHSFGDRVHPIWESAVHDIDLALSFVNAPAISVTAVSSKAAGELSPAVVSALVVFQGGVTATIETAWLIPPTAPSTLAGALELDGSIIAEAELLGTKGVMRQRLLSDGLVEWTPDGSCVPDLWLWPETDGRIGGALRAEIDHTLAVVSRQTDQRLMPLKEACWGVEIAEAMIESIHEGKTIHLRSTSGGQ